MKVCVAGSRSLELTPDEVWTYVEKVCATPPTVIVHGNAEGIDKTAGLAAIARGIPVEVHEPSWSTFGRYAGMMRNIHMAHAADLVIAIWDGHSNGTNHMINYARQHGMPVYVFEVKK